MSEYWIEVLNRASLMIPAFLSGLCIGIQIKGRKWRNMKRKLLFFEATTIYYLHKFLAQICHRLSAKHTEIYNRIIEKWGRTWQRRNIR